MQGEAVACLAMLLALSYETMILHVRLLLAVEVAWLLMVLPVMLALAVVAARVLLLLVLAAAAAHDCPAALQHALTLLPPRQES